MLPEIIDKFQQFITDYSECVIERVQELLPDLSPEEQQDATILQSETYFAHCMYQATREYFATTYQMGFGCYFSTDIFLNNGNLTASVPEFMGTDSSSYWGDLFDIDEMIDAVRANPLTFTVNDGEVYAFLGSEWARFKAYHEGVYYDNYVHLKYGDPDVYTQMVTTRFNIWNNKAQYTTSTSSGHTVLTPVSPSSSQLIPNSIDGLAAIKDYAIVGNIKDISDINNFISHQGATNNYHSTYTTSNNKTIQVYYGDNYIITHVDNDEPVSYNDVKNALNIAVNQINDDNNIDMNVPDYPIPPPPEPIIDDDYTDMGLGVETDGMAMYNMAVVTRNDLIALITDFEANSDTGLSFLPHVLGLYKLGISSGQLLTTITDKIRLHKEPGKIAFASAADYSIVDEQETYIDCGSITVDREELLTNTFLDFSPYTTYEMFIPGCGWITLPDTVVGRTLTVSIVFDLATCSCKGIVRCGTTLLKSGTTIATVNGIIGSSVPLSINETGLQKAAIMNGSTQAAMALGTAFMGVGIGNPYMGASGVAMAAGALASNHIAGNSTYTNTKGGATDYSIFGDGWKAVLKITRPVLEVPDNYGHTVGFVVNRYDTLSSFSGFTVCVNPHIHISATSDEKEEIKRLLEEGVILPEGE